MTRALLIAIPVSALMWVAIAYLTVNLLERF